MSFKSLVNSVVSKPAPDFKERSIDDWEDVDFCTLLANFWDQSIKKVTKVPSLGTCVSSYSEIQVVSTQKLGLDNMIFEMPFSRYGLEVPGIGGRLPIYGIYVSIQ